MTEEWNAAVLKAEHAIKYILLDLENDYGIKITVDVHTDQFGNHAVSINTDLDD